MTFFSTFAAAPLIATIRQDLNLTRSAVNGANIAAVSLAAFWLLCVLICMTSLTPRALYVQITGTVFARLMLGTFTNHFGPRYAMGFLLLLSSSAVFGMALVNDSASFIVCRCLIGFSLSSFVACQYWTSVMFTAPLVGSANALAGGWGNLGGGVTQVTQHGLHGTVKVNNS